jgi:cytochrome P450
MLAGPQIMSAIGLPSGVVEKTKDVATFGTLRLILGNGLFTSDGDFWLRQRRLAQPAFHRRRVAAFGDLMTEATLAMLECWPPICPTYLTRAWW